MSNRSGRGFTLIELLVVVSIISLLVAILLPALGKARDAGRVAACMSNVHQVMVASQIYLTENDDRYYEYRQGELAARSPAYRDCGQGGIPANENVTPDHPDYGVLSAVEDWRPINQFVANYEIWQCPSDRGRAAVTVGAQSYPAAKPHMWSDPYAGASYIFNTAGIPKYWNTGVPNGNKNVANNAGRIRQPSLFAVFFEYSMYDVNWAPIQEGCFGITGMGYGLAGSANFHEPYFDEPSSVTGFADTHVARLKGIRGAGGGTPEFTLVPNYGSKAAN